MGLIQTLIPVLKNKDEDLQSKILWAIIYIIRVRIREIKEGEQHPFLTPLTNDGTISQLIQIIKDGDEQPAQILAYLYKALALPFEIEKVVIEKLKRFPSNFEELALLAECKDNHNQILAKEFENQLFEYESDSLSSLRLILNILKFGTNENKIKISNAIKDKVEKLAFQNDKNKIEEEEEYLDKEEKEEIKLKAKGPQHKPTQSAQSSPLQVSSKVVTQPLRHLFLIMKFNPLPN
ncbi:MAG: hypothetical protein EZS28_031838 [Streblomastix strix]|uniref:Uncharacterized protein n=1 Tax=Streblomastix strix TaxID=222440 RepID=A0A5J4UR30_9EUKA|nr:MAG: hypothetical protein EZS28_031838 [Streblomastix strix]